MQIHTGLKAELTVAAGGVAAPANDGFTWGGWRHDQTKSEVVVALIPIDIKPSGQDPQVSETLAKLKDPSSYPRSDMLMQAGWATTLGSCKPNRKVARVCTKELAVHV